MPSKGNGYVFDGPDWNGEVYTFVTFQDDTERTLRKGAVLTAEEVKSLIPESLRDIERWLALGAIHETTAGGAEAPTEPGGKE